MLVEKITTNIKDYFTVIGIALFNYDVLFIICISLLADSIVKKNMGTHMSVAP